MLLTCAVELLSIAVRYLKPMAGLRRTIVQLSKARTASHYKDVCNFITRHDKVPEKRKTNIFQQKGIEIAGQEDYKSKVYLKNIRE